MHSVENLHILEKKNISKMELESPESFYCTHVLNIKTGRAQSIEV